MSFIILRFIPLERVGILTGQSSAFCETLQFFRHGYFFHDDITFLFFRFLKRHFVQVNVVGNHFLLINITNFVDWLSNLDFFFLLSAQSFFRLNVSINIFYSRQTTIGFDCLRLGLANLHGWIHFFLNFTHTLCFIVKNIGLIFVRILHTKLYSKCQRKFKLNYKFPSLHSLNNTLNHNLMVLIII